MFVFEINKLANDVFIVAYAVYWIVVAALCKTMCVNI